MEHDEEPEICENCGIFKCAHSVQSYQYNCRISLMTNYKDSFAILYIAVIFNSNDENAQFVHYIGKENFWTYYKTIESIEQKAKCLDLLQKASDLMITRRKERRSNHYLALLEKIIDPNIIFPNEIKIMIVNQII
ncbi:hypothetical protein PV-S19_0110 [Pacmanvirus S19]|nr:hypothetical protein PV-S19_0110 [Pacmanvirus S19]